MRVATGLLPQNEQHDTAELLTGGLAQPGNMASTPGPGPPGTPLSPLDAKVSALVRQVDRLRGVLHESPGAAELDASLGALQAELGAVTRENAELRASFDRARQEAERLRAENAALAAKREDDELDHQLARALNETEKLKAAADGYKHDMLTQKLAKRERELAAAREALREAEDESAGLTQMVQQLKGAAQAAEAQLQALHRENDVFKSGSMPPAEAADNHATANGKAGALAPPALASAASKALKDVAELERKLRLATQENERLVKEVEDLNNTVFSKTFKAPSAWAEREVKYKMDKKAWEMREAGLKDKIVALQRENQRLRDDTQVHDLEHTINNLQVAASTAEQEKVAAQRALHDLQMELRKADGEYTSFGRSATFNRSEREDSSDTDSVAHMIDRLEDEGVGVRPPGARETARTVSGRTYFTPSPLGPAREPRGTGDHVQEIVSDYDAQKIGVREPAPMKSSPSKTAPGQRRTADVTVSTAGERSPVSQGSEQLQDIITDFDLGGLGASRIPLPPDSLPRHAARPGIPDTSLPHPPEASTAHGAAPVNGTSHCATGDRFGSARASSDLQRAHFSNGQAGLPPLAAAGRAGSVPSTSAPATSAPATSVSANSAPANSAPTTSPHANAAAAKTASATSEPAEALPVPQAAPRSDHGGELPVSTASTAGEAAASATSAAAPAATMGAAGASGMASAAAGAGSAAVPARAGSGVGTSAAGAGSAAAAGVSSQLVTEGTAPAGPRSATAGSSSGGAGEQHRTRANGLETPASSSGSYLPRPDAPDAGSGSGATLAGSSAGPPLAGGRQTDDQAPSAAAAEAMATAQALGYSPRLPQRMDSVASDWTPERLAALEDDRLETEQAWAAHAQRNDLGALQYKAAEAESRAEMYQAQIEKMQRSLERADQDKARLEQDLAQALASDAKGLASMRERLKDMLTRRTTPQEQAEEQLQELEAALQDSFRERNLLQKRNRALQRELAGLAGKLGVASPLLDSRSAAASELAPVEEGAAESTEEGAAQQQLTESRTASGTSAAGASAAQASAGSASAADPTALAVAPGGAAAPGDAGGGASVSLNVSPGAARAKRNKSWRAGDIISGLTDEEVEVMRLREENEALMESLVRTKVELAETQGDYLKAKRALIRAVEKQALLSEKMDTLRNAFPDGGPLLGVTPAGIVAEWPPQQRGSTAPARASVEAAGPLSQAGGAAAPAIGAGGATASSKSAAAQAGKAGAGRPAGDASRLGSTRQATVSSEIEPASGVCTVTELPSC